MSVPASSPSPLYSYSAAAATCALTTGLSWLLRGAVDLSNIVLFYVLCVVVVAALWGRGAAVLASLLSVACFNFFFVPPLFSFEVADAQYLITFAAMLLVSILISYLSNAYRDKAAEAERRAGELALLNEFAQSLSAALSVEHVAELLQRFFRSHFDAGSNLFVPDKIEHLQLVGAGAINIVEQTLVQGVYASGQATGAVADVHEDANTILLPLKGSTRGRGVVAIYATSDMPSIDRNLLAALSALVATAVERIHFVEVAQASELEAQSVRLRSSILSAISHDIRTPLTVLYGLADALLDGQMPQTKQSETMQAMRDQAYRLHRMVDNLLDMARLRSGKVTLRLDWQAIPEIVAASVQALSLTLSERTVQIHWPPELPLLMLDALLMERVFCNLLENAAKYSPPQSTISLSAQVIGDSVVVYVDNEGSGFPADRIDQLFQLFERGEAESAIPGVGVGLSICRTIVEAHGGQIAAHNRPNGSGARVSIMMPLPQTPAIPPESEADHA